jgi:hypothetical protein
VESPTERLAKKLAARTKHEKEADPHGFHEMTERELIDWLGAGHAQPGSQVYEHAKLVLQSKQNARLLVHGLDSQPEERPEPEPEPVRMTGLHVTILALVLAAFVGLAAVVQLPVTRILAVVVVALVLAAVFVRPIREPTLRLIDRALG